MKIDKSPTKILASIVIWLDHHKKKYDYENINSVCPLYLIIGKANGYIEENNENKYLVLASTDGNKKVLAKFKKLLDEIEHLTQTKDEGRKGEYEKNFMKIKFNSDNNFPLYKMLKLHVLSVIVRSVLEDDDKYYPQVFLNECLYEV